MKIDLSTAVGLVAGIIIISIGIVGNSGELYWFVNGISLLVVLGGTLSATLVNYSMKSLLGLYPVLKNVFTHESYEYQLVIEEIVKKAKIARKSGVVSLEKELNTIDDNFLRNGIELAINERDSKRLRTFLALEIDNIERRHASGQEIFFYMGAYAPAFGMLGTIMGLIIMMENFGGAQIGMQIDTIKFVIFDVEEIDSINFNIAEKFAGLLQGMGLALITTFYGVLFSNLVFLPIGGKLKRKSQDEIMVRNIIVEGIMSIHAKEHPILIHEKLMTFVQESKRPNKD